MAAATSTNADPLGQPAGLTLPQRWTPSLPTSLLSLLSPFAAAAASPTDSSDNGNGNGNSKTTSNDPNPQPDHSGNAADPDVPSAAPQSTPKRPILSATQFSKMSIEQPPSPSRSSGSIMFAEPDARSTSEEGSRDGSIDEVKRYRRSMRSKTCYSLCHPVPESKVKQKLHRQPRSLLQLHRLQPNARPLPALEVISSANFSVRLTRSITKVFHAKHGFCANDLVVLKAEKYGTQDEEPEARDVIGMICKGSREEQKSGSGRMAIYMASGRQWEAYSIPTGGYECCTTDEHGLKETVRWVPKKAKDGRGASSNATRKFNFSTISPHTRRHPVIASLQKTGLEINDTYKIPDPLVTTPLGTPKTTATALEDAFEEENISGNHECTTDNATQEIIAVTAIWVAMREGWSPSIKCDDKRDSLGIDLPSSPARAATGPILSPPGSPAPHAPLDNRASVLSFGSGIIRKASLLSRSNRNSMREESDVESLAPSRSASINLAQAGRSRADSSATVLVHRAASNRRKKTEATLGFRPEPTGEPHLDETSREDLASNSSSNKGSPADTPAKPRPSPSTRITASEGEENASPAKRQSRSVTPEDKTGHRSSTTTNGTINTMLASQQRRPSHPMPQIRSRRRAKVWRRLLCGSKSID